MDDDREETLYHGTTYDVAQKICAQKKFELQGTYFASTRELAEFFAIRSCGKRSGAHLPAILRVVLYESASKTRKRSRLVISTGFSDGDRADLQGKTQLLFSAEAVRFLNRDMFPGDLKVEQVRQDG